MAGRRWAIPASHARKILPIRALAPRVSEPDWMAGIVEERGRSLGVVDLRKRFSGKAESASARIVVARLKTTLVGLIVDAVEAVDEFSQSSIRSAEPRAGEPTGCSGVARQGDKGENVWILDLRTLFADSEMRQLEDVFERRAAAVSSGGGA